MFHHECRADSGSVGPDGEPVARALSLAYTVRSDFGNWSQLSTLSKNLGAEWRDRYGEGEAVVFVGDKLVAWDDGASTLSTVYDLFDVLDPVQDAYQSEAYALITAACRAANGKESAK